MPVKDLVNTEVIHIRLSPELKALLIAHARSHRKSYSELARHFLADSLQDTEYACPWCPKPDEEPKGDAQ